jgi:hypothetical protein
MWPLTADGLRKTLLAAKFGEFRDLIGLLKIMSDENSSNNSLYSKNSSSNGGADLNAGTTDSTKDFN